MDKPWARAALLAMLGVIAAVVLILVFDYVRDHARPMAPSPGELGNLELRGPRQGEMVVVTMDDERYHLEGCREIKGPTEKIVYEEALRRGLEPCPFCIGGE